MFNNKCNNIVFGHLKKIQYHYIIVSNILLEKDTFITKKVRKMKYQNKENAFN